MHAGGVVGFAGRRTVMETLELPALVEGVWRGDERGGGGG